MAKLLMITGLGSVRDLASGRKGAFYNTLEEFSKYWDRIDIISPKVESRKWKVESFFGNVYVHTSPWPLVFYPVFFIKKALEIYKEQKFDLMTVHDFPPFYNGIAARILWHKIKVPYLLEIFHIPGHPKEADLKERIYKFIFKLFIKFDALRAKAIRTMNQSEVPEFLIKAGVPKEKIIHIPAIYIDLDIFRPTDSVKEYDLIFVGRLEKNKGPDIFLEVVKKLNCKAIIVGDGPLREKLELQTTNYRLQTNLSFHGWAKDQREIAELINKSKLLVMTSYNEGGPRVVVEALACGVPVLATPIGIVPDLLKNASGGEIIGWKAEDIAMQVTGLLSDLEKYRKYSHDGPEIAKQFEKKEAIKNYALKIKSLI